jgi:signal transduction histidine kinase
MRALLRSLSNRIFLASALLAVCSIVAAVWQINRTVTRQAESEIIRGLDEAGDLVDEYRRLKTLQLAQSAELVADLPKFKAAVELNDPPTVAPLAADYSQRLRADVFVVQGRDGRVLARIGELPSLPDVAVLPPADSPPGATPAISFMAAPHALLQLVTVPIWIDSATPDLLGTLTVGVSLDASFAGEIKRLTDSDIVFLWRGRPAAGTLAPFRAAPLHEAMAASEPLDRLTLGDEEYHAAVRPLGPGAHAEHGQVVILRSRSERLAPLRALHGALAGIAIVAVLLATLLSYLVARTMTRPLRALTARMRDMAESGDLSAHAALPATPRWSDEDARVLATTFNAMTESIGRFQRDAALRERLSALGRLSTALAHEIRNPLMIIKAALRTLRRAPDAGGTQAASIADIDEEVGRLNRLVDQVLDFARPVRFDFAPAVLSEICRDAAAACEADGTGVRCELRFDPAAEAVVTDAERLRQALINVQTNARQAVASVAGAAVGAGVPIDGASPSPGVVLTTAAVGQGRVRITVRDIGPGLDTATLARIFDPFFTTRPSGTGIGLAITRNVIEGLGGTIHARSREGAGTEIAIDLPRDSGPAKP